MKKLFTSMAALALAFSAGAQQHNFEFTADPVNGSDIDKLQFVILTFPNLDEVEINTASDIKYTRGDGSNIRGVEFSESGNQIEFIFGAEQTDNGTYTIFIPAGNIAGYADDYAWMEDSPEDIVLTYTIGGGAQSGFDWSYTIDPEPGVVTELGTITLTFPNLYDIDIVDKNDVILTCDGEVVSGYKVSVSYTAPAVEIKMPNNTPLTTPGKYVLTIQAENIDTWTEDETGYEALPETLYFEWTIGGQTPVLPDYGWDYTVDPAEGEISKLQFVTLTFPSIDELEINSESSITYKRGDGSNIRGVDVSVNENALEFVFGAEQTDKGTYTITIPAETLAGYAGLTDDGYSWMGDNPEDIVLTYTIGGSSEGFDWSYMIDPEPGVVTELGDITLYFPELFIIDVNSNKVKFTHDGEVVSGCEKYFSEDEWDAMISIIMPNSEALTEPGEYKLTIEPGGIMTANEDYSMDEENEEPFEFVWTIETPGVDFAYTASLTDEAPLSYFDELTLTFDKLEKVEYTGEGVTVKFNDEGADVDVKTDANKLTLTLKEALNFVNGTVVVNIAEGCINGTADGVTAANATAIELTYELVKPVGFSLELAISTPKPNANGEISAEKDLASMFFVCEQKGLVAAPGTADNVTIKEVNGDFEASAHLRKGTGLNSNYTYFVVDFRKNPTYNGEYVITVAREAFGTAEWAEDPNYGETNAELELKFTLVDGKDRVTYTLEPESVNPEAGAYANGETIATVVLTFADGIVMADDAAATLAGVDNSYAETASFKAVDGGFAVTFETAPTEDGKYVLTVNAGAFGEESFINGGNGKGSAEISIDYTIDSTLTAVEMVVADKNAKVYDLFGRQIKSVDRLAPGIYVINGKKVIVK